MFVINDKRLRSIVLKNNNFFIMSALRRLSHEVRQMLTNPSKQMIEPLSVTAFQRNSLSVHSTKTSDTVKWNSPHVFTKCNFHTSVVSRDLEAGLKSLGAGLSMIGAIGPGIGIGTLFGQVVAGVARNPSTKDQLFMMAIIGTVFCETICLFCFLVTMIILNS